jgi:glucose-6-phosphate 1-dehydrogenase
MNDRSSGTVTMEPTIFVIFGITGDLSKRYLLPALYHLFKDGRLDEHTQIIGVTRRDLSTDQLLETVELCVNEADKVCDPAVLKVMHQQSRMVQMDLNDSESYARLHETLDQIEADKGVCMNRLFYLSIPPQVYGPVIEHMGEQGLNSGCQHGTAVSRLLVEKPFGYDLSSAKDLVSKTEQVFSEEQTFRIDHYQAKEGVQDLLRFRFQYPELESVWTSEHIEYIEVAVSEALGIEGRVRFYEPLGALRDFLQNHLLQILTLTTMQLPSALTSEAIHDMKQQLLEHIQHVPADQVAQLTIRGQYAGYLDEVENPNSHTETYADIGLNIETDRWRNVPLRLWTGKLLDAKRSTVTVNFRGGGSLNFHIQPEVGLEIKGEVPAVVSQAVADFHSTADARPNAYEKVLSDAIVGDHTLFVSSEEALASWRIVQPVLDEWAKNNDDLVIYAPGSSGPLSSEN